VTATFYPNMFPSATEKSLIPIRVFSEDTVQRARWDCVGHRGDDSPIGQNTENKKAAPPG